MAGGLIDFSLRRQLKQHMKRVQCIRRIFLFVHSCLIVCMLVQTSRAFTSIALRRFGRPGVLTSSTMSASASSLAPKNLVVVIAGPTAAGKSDVAAKICADERGIIVSADSVQAYRGVQIGANKPSVEERKETPHILIDVVNHTQNYNAAEWRADAVAAIQNLIDPQGDTDDNNPRKDDVVNAVKNGRMTKGYSGDEKLLPVVCGGTMMYLQWLVHGAPDAVRPGENAIEQAHTTISKFERSNDFQGALKHVASFGQLFSDRIDGFCGEDWCVSLLLCQVYVSSDSCSHVLRYFAGTDCAEPWKWP
jgi:hypothetical protein